MEVGISRRDPRLRARAVFCARLSRAAASVGTGRDADPAEDESDLLPGSFVPPACRVPVVDGDISGRNPETDFLSGTGAFLLYRVAAGERYECAARNAPRTVRTAQHHLLRAVVARNRLDPDLRALQHGEVLDLHKNLQGFFHPEAAQVQRDTEGGQRGSLRNLCAAIDPVDRLAGVGDLGDDRLLLWLGQLPRSRLVLSRVLAERILDCLERLLCGFCGVAKP